MVRALPEVGKHLLGRTRSCEEKSRSAEMASILRLPEASNRSLEEGYLYWYHKSIILQKNIMQYLCKQSSQYRIYLKIGPGSKISPYPLSRPVEVLTTAFSTATAKVRQPQRKSYRSLVTVVASTSCFSQPGPWIRPVASCRS